VSDADENDRLWSGFSVANELNPAQRHRWRLVVNELSGLPPAAMVVDLGCGSGLLLSRIAAARPAGKFLGVDADPTALRYAAERLPSAHLIRADLDADPSELPAEADGVVCSEVLEHLETPLHAVRLAHRLLRRGGRFVVTVPAGPVTPFDRAIGHRKHFTLPAIDELLVAGGFRIVHSYYWGFPFHTLFRIGVGALPSAADGFSDDRLGGWQRIVFRLLDALFYLNGKSRRLGRQIVAVAERA
jgi:SAM-dependent methyltransferase